MTTWMARAHTIETQKVQEFTGEGAYHGSTGQKSPTAPRPRVETVPEARPTTLERYLERGETGIAQFDADIPNRLRVVAQPDVPSQEEVRDDGVTFCWCSFEEALREAGPVTRRVLAGMSGGISGRKRHVYVDSKIQYFEPGDLPVDSELWHVDGSIAVRDERVLPFGVPILHDMRARLEHADPPRYMAYQSSAHCATEFLHEPIHMRLRELIPNFKEYDSAVRASGAAPIAHPAGAILSYDGLTSHRPTRATSRGWRLWIRCTETDVEIHPGPSVIECYGTVFRPRP